MKFKTSETVQFLYLKYASLKNSNDKISELNYKICQDEMFETCYHLVGSLYSLNRNLFEDKNEFKHLCGRAFTSALKDYQLNKNTQFFSYFVTKVKGYIRHHSRDRISTYINIPTQITTLAQKMFKDNIPKTNFDLHKYAEKVNKNSKVKYTLQTFESAYQVYTEKYTFSSLDLNLDSTGTLTEFENMSYAYQNIPDDNVNFARDIIDFIDILVNEQNIKNHFTLARKIQEKFQLESGVSPNQVKSVLRILAI